MKRVLLTGIGGFIGSHALEHFLINTDWHIIGVASWRHKGVPERVSQSKYYQENKERVDIVTHDLTAPFSQQTKEFIGHPDIIINIASESHVDRSITHPEEFIQNNVDLIINMLEYAKEVKPDVFMQISTDEVYGVAPVGTAHKEWDPIVPSNPYSASKAAQEAIAISYWRSYNVPVIITNTMNNFGERQDKEKFIPLVISKVLSGDKLMVHCHADGKTAGSRFYLHARNHADALLYIINNWAPEMFTTGAARLSRFNVLGEIEVNNLEMAQMIAGMIGKPLNYELVDFHSSRPGHDPRYALDGTKLKEAGWVMPINFEDSLRKTVQWYLTHPEWLK